MPSLPLDQALGVVVDVSRLHLGRVTVNNTIGRKDEIAASIRHILQTGLLHRHEAFRLLGRLQFVAGQIFGRIAKRCLALVTYHAYSEHGLDINDMRGRTWLSLNSSSP